MIGNGGDSASIPNSTFAHSSLVAADLATSLTIAVSSASLAALLSRIYIDYL